MLFLQTLWEICASEADIEALCAQLEGIRSVLSTCRSPLMTADFVNAFCKRLFELLNEYTSRLYGEDTDDSEDSFLSMQKHEEDQVKSAISEALGALFRTHPVQAEPLLKFVVEVLSTNYLEPECSDSDHKFALFVIDDLLACYGPLKLASVFPELYDVIISMSIDRADTVRQAALHCLGILAAKSDSQSFYSWTAKTLTALETALKIPVTASVKSNGLAYDNAVGALGRLIKFQEACLDTSTLVPAWINLLPLRFDKHEARTMHDFLAEILLANFQTLVQGRQDLLLKSMQVFAAVLNTKLLADHSVEKVQQLLLRLNEYPQLVMSISAAMNEEERHKLGV